jgi:hypothetical protein
MCCAVAESGMLAGSGYSSKLECFAGLGPMFLPSGALVDLRTTCLGRSEGGSLRCPRS